MKPKMDTQIPLRQKILLCFTIIIGFAVLILYHLRIVDAEVMEMILFFYFFFVPFFLLGFDALTDLNNNRIFSIWLIIGIIYFVIYLFIKEMDAIWIGSAKTLFIFLIAYKVLNTIMKKTNGTYLINTYRKLSWKHDVANRKITGLDVFFNILLYIVLIASIIIK